MIEVAWWWHVGAVAIQSFGYWQAGNGWRWGWVLAALTHAAWFGYAVATHQPLIALGGLTYAVVAYRNSRKEKRVPGTETTAGPV